MALSHSPVTEHNFRGFPFYLKRDDLLHPHFSGNKARKLKTLMEEPLPHIKTLISYGSPQANSLYSFAALAYLRGWEFEFYVDHIPEMLINHPIGNYKGAIGLGAKVIPVQQRAEKGTHPKDFINDIRQPDESCLVIPEGGRCGLAEEGINSLACELLDFIRLHQLQNVVVALPSGTGTTAIFLHNQLKEHDVEVLTCACVGDNQYLESQFKELKPDTTFPTVLSLEKKHHFGKLYDEHYAIWDELKLETQVEFELLYDPIMWRCLEEWLPNNQDKTLIYLHQGGILGNQSMLARYKYRLRQKLS
ncbi:1-aminocyclopropane-1-carboxylate deaminase/D-cysteine desulfhydrase [Vibrio sp.]|nr:1-aminocyclopropane-1-carboxylate deaminase/D-cysteine desulfhydrase [Vibrio sp.]